MTEVKRGGIRLEDAYAQGKMLDHSDWDGQLERLITPSDVDLFFDANGRILFCELSSWATEWDQLSTGQIRAFTGMIRNSQHCYALCTHNVADKTKQINTFLDIEYFRPMIFHGGRIVKCQSYAKHRWVRFVKAWVQNPLRAHQILVEHYHRSAS